MEATLEQQILAELRTVTVDMQEMKGQVRDLRTVLMGDGVRETPHGRLPKVESQIEDHEVRIASLEEDRTIYQVYGRFAHYIWGGGVAIGAALLERLMEHFLGK